MVTTMNIYKVIKSKYTNYKVENEKADDLRRNGDVTQYFKDVSGSKMSAIQVTMITPTDTFTERGRAGSHSMLESIMVGSINSNRISKMHGYYAHLIARELGYVVIEFAGFINGGNVVIVTPETLNEYQINEIEKINNDIKKWNSENDKECYKATAHIIDPETGLEVTDIDPVIEKYRARLQENKIVK